MYVEVKERFEGGRYEPVIVNLSLVRVIRPTDDPDTCQAVFGPESQVPTGDSNHIMLAESFSDLNELCEIANSMLGLSEQALETAAATAKYLADKGEKNG